MKHDTKCKTIGLVLEDAFTDYAKDIAHSVAHSVAMRDDVKLIVVAGRQDNELDPKDRLHPYKRMYNSIYRIHTRMKFDGLMFTFPVYAGEEGKAFEDIPKVFIASEIPGEITVNYDNAMGIREALEYLVKIKGYTKICMLGGRDDNVDAQKRKNVFSEYMEEVGLVFTEAQYERTDMSVNSHAAAAKLLARNPDTQAIFCVNDPVAQALYDVMQEKGLVPGIDIQVFGFDNSAMAGQMVPPLASIGTDGMTVGQKAVELLINMINGQEVESAIVPTRVFARESFEYETYGITTRDILEVDSVFINNFFDDCFYHYGNEVVDSGDIDLRRLFYEIISRMMGALKHRYMDESEFIKIRRMIDVFFGNRAMKYTDANKFIRSISRLQSSMNETVRQLPAGNYNNRLFSYMKDKAIQWQAYAKAVESKIFAAARNRSFNFMIANVDFEQSDENGIERLINNFDMIGFSNAALYLYDKPVERRGDGRMEFPTSINLRCVLRDGKLYVIPKERRQCSIEDIYYRSELPNEVMGYISFPLFGGRYLFGLFVCAINRQLMDNGENMAFLFGQTIYTNLIGEMNTITEGITL